MDERTRKLMDYSSEAMDHTDVSSFELFEILDIRSQLATHGPLLSDEGKAHLEQLDRRLLEVADFAEMRQRGHILPSHWLSGIWTGLCRRSAKLPR